MLPIFQNESGNGASPAFKISEAFQDTSVPTLAGEFVTVLAAGVFDGASVQLQIGPTRDGPWVDFEDGTFTAPVAKVSPISRRAYIRAELSSAGVSTDISLWVG